MIGDETLQNYGGGSYGSLDLRTATWKSVNAVFARLILDVGVDKTMEMAQRLGVDMPVYDPALYGASVALGAIEVSPLQMASAFGVFGNGGRRAPPSPIIQVLGPDGSVVLDNTKAIEQAQQAIPEIVADNVTDVLKGVLTDGTAAGKGIDRPAAGKTGTAQDNGNAWFVGYTPSLSTAVWIGYQSGNLPMNGILGVRGGMTGGAVPAATWQRFMENALANVPVTDFNEPAPIRSIADQVKRDARGGFDPGAPRYPAKTPSGGPYVYEPEAPVAEAPTTTVTPTTSTTTTTRPTTTQPPITLLPP